MKIVIAIFLIIFFRHEVSPSNFQKNLLIWSGRYKTREEIPKRVSYETIDKAKNKMRIKCANYMMLATVIGCLTMVFIGRKAAERGESVTKMNLDWHREMNKKYEEQQAKAQEASKK